MLDKRCERLQVTIASSSAFLWMNKYQRHLMEITFTFTNPLQCEEKRFWGSVWRRVWDADEQLPKKLISSACLIVVSISFVFCGSRNEFLLFRSVNWVESKSPGHGFWFGAEQLFFVFGKVNEILNFFVVCWNKRNALLHYWPVVVPETTSTDSEKVNFCTLSLPRLVLSGNFLKLLLSMN